MKDIFISYASEDREHVKRLAEALKTTGNWSVFWDRVIPPGMAWYEVIGTELQQARCVVVAWSEAAVRSEWVREEADEGKKRKILIPVFLHSAASAPMGFRSIQGVDLTNWDGSPEAAEFQLLLSAVRRVVGPQPSAAETQPPPSMSAGFAPNSREARPPSPPAADHPPDDVEARFRGAASLEPGPGSSWKEKLMSSPAGLAAAAAVALLGAAVGFLQFSERSLTPDDPPSAITRTSPQDINPPVKPAATGQIVNREPVPPPPAGGSDAGPSARPAERATAPPPAAKRPAASPQVSAAPVRVGGTIKQPTKIKNVAPVYPPIAQAAKMEGTVILEITIGTNGKVTGARVLRSVALLDQAATDAVMQWEFTPTLLDGVPVPVIMTVTVNFKLTPSTDSDGQKDDPGITRDLRAK